MTEPFNVQLNIDTSQTTTDISIRTFEQELGHNLLTYIQQFETSKHKIGIKTSQVTSLILKEDIIFAEVFDKQLNIITLTTRMSLTALQQTLTKQKFVQNSKSSIVNIEHITKV